MENYKPVTQETIVKYFNNCANHDWYFEFSENSVIYNNGKSNEIYLKSFHDIPIYKKIYFDWSDYIFSGESYGTEKREKPNVENYIKEGF